MPNYTIEEIEAMNYITSTERANILVDPTIKTMTLRCHDCDNTFPFTGTFRELFQGTNYPKPPLACPHCGVEDLDALTPDGFTSEDFQRIEQAYLWWLRYNPTPEPNTAIFDFIDGGIK